MQWNLGPPRQRYEDAIIDVAAKASTDLDGLAVLARAVQGRRTTARRLLSNVQARSRIARRSWVTDVLADIAGGTCSVLDHGCLTLVERPHGLPSADRQVAALGSTGVIYRDTEYAERLVIELDGRLFHDSVEARDADFERDLDTALLGLDTRRIAWGQVLAQRQ